MSSYWQNRVVLITGASSGIGRALALEAARRGARLALVARRADLLESFVEEVERNGGRALALAADVRDADAMRRAADRALAEFGRIDTLVANAGVAMKTPGWKIMPQEVADTFAINLLGAVNAANAVLPHMLARGGGHLVAISSLAAFRGLPQSSAYSASKAAMSTYFESLRVDLRRSGIDVTTIHPGFIRTAMTGGASGRAPFMLELDDATAKIMRAIERRQRAYAFPWRLATIVRLARFMPDSLYDLSARSLTPRR